VNAGNCDFSNNVAGGIHGDWLTIVTRMNCDVAYPAKTLFISHSPGSTTVEPPSMDVFGNMDKLGKQ
jgi:hypothetical protein